jgi:DNA repair exonuclease SbcCD ATPase subunit
MKTKEELQTEIDRLRASIAEKDEALLSTLPEMLGLTPDEYVNRFGYFQSQVADKVKQALSSTGSELMAELKAKGDLLKENAETISGLTAKCDELMERLGKVEAGLAEKERQLSVALKGKRPFSTKLADEVIAGQVKCIAELQDRLAELAANSAEVERLKAMKRPWITVYEAIAATDREKAKVRQIEAQCTSLAARLGKAEMQVEAYKANAERGVALVQRLNAERKTYREGCEKIAEKRDKLGKALEVMIKRYVGQRQNDGFYGFINDARKILAEWHLTIFPEPKTQTKTQ